MDPVKKEIEAIKMFEKWHDSLDFYSEPKTMEELRVSIKCGKGWVFEQTDEVRIEVYNRLAKAEWDELREKQRHMKIQTADGNIFPMPELPEWQDA